MADEEFVLVPRKMTELMDVAFAEVFYLKRRGFEDDIHDCWEAILAASPTPPAAPVAAESGDAATIAGLEASIGHLSSLVNTQLLLLEEVEDICGRDGHGGELEDGESAIIDKVRAHLSAMSPPIAPSDAGGVE